MLLIGLSGKAGSGKTTCAEYMVKEWGFKELSFADPLKNAVCAMLDITRSELEELKVNGEYVAESDKNMRFILQTLGTNWGRNIISQNLWESLLANRITKLYEANKNVCIVIPDIRFLNELNLVHLLLGKTVFIDASTELLDKRLHTENTKTHESESYLDTIKEKCHHVIPNNKTIKHMLESLRDLIL